MKIPKALKKDGFDEVGGIPVFKKAFLLHDTYGMQLADLTVECMKKGMAVSFEDFQRDAEQAGWKPEKIKREIQEAIDWAKNAFA